MSLIARAIDRRYLEPVRQGKATQFEQLVPAPGALVFLGDSITEGGLWHEWFPHREVANRGIGGDTADGVLARLDVALQGAPSRIILLIGTNDLTLGRSVDAILCDVRAVATQVVGRGVSLTIQSVMPRTPAYRDRILRLNTGYRSIARESDVEYLDLWSTLADASGALRSDYTVDRLHLTGPAYKAWAALLDDHLEG